MLQYYRSIVYARCFFLEKEASMVIQINSQVIHYEHTYCEASSNPPLLLLHGNGEDLHIFDELIFSLRNEYEIYALDARGHGLSAAPDVLHYDDMAEDVAGISCGIISRKHEMKLLCLNIVCIVEVRVLYIYHGLIVLP